MNNDQINQEIVARHKNGETLVSIAKKLGMGKEAVKKRWQKHKDNPQYQHVIHKANDDYVKNRMEQVEFEHNADGSLTRGALIGVEDESFLKDPKYLLKIHGFDPNEFELIKARNSIWNAQQKGGTKVKYYASKIDVRRKEHPVDLEEFKEYFESFKPRKHIPKRKVDKNGLLMTVEYADFHIGKLAWHEEVGQNFDMKIAKSIFDEVLQGTLDRAKRIKPERIIFTVGNDFFHFDKVVPETTAGTRQDVDTRWQDMLIKGASALIEAVSCLSEVAPVEVIYVPGNHDKQTSFFVFQLLKTQFRNDDNVIFNENIMTRKYVLWGIVLLGFSHGKDEGKRIYECMQVEASKEWGKSRFREFHLGHLHTEQDTVEKGGVIYRRLPTVTSTDAWTFESGYVGAVRKVKLFVYDKEYGLIDSPMVPYVD